MEVIMKKILTAVASLSLLASPLAVQAAPQHGGGSAGAFHGQAAGHAPAAFGGHGVARGGGGAFRGGGFRGGGFRGGGFRGRGYYPGYGYALGGLGLGLVAGAALADSYGYPGYYAPYDYGYDDDYPAYGAPAQACGEWVWVPSRSKYIWDAGPCE
jgi:hypothetical protein